MADRPRGQSVGQWREHGRIPRILKRSFVDETPWDKLESDPFKIAKAPNETIVRMAAYLVRRKERRLFYSMEVGL